MLTTFNVPPPVHAAASFRFPTLSPPPTQANVTLAVRPSIAGRPDIPFAGVSTSGSTVTWPLPAGVLGGSATLVFSPRSPDDQTSPVHSFPIGVVTAMSIDVSSDPFVTISGRVTLAGGVDLPGGFAARAFASGAAVSNAPALEDGNYVLLVSRAVAQSDAGLVVEVGPGSGGGDPTFSFAARSFADNTALDTIELPAYTSPQQFGLTVLGDMPSGPPIASARVRLTSTLPDADPTQAAVGTAEFVADASTDASGFARLALLPGTLSSLRTYEVAVVPPPGSPYATTCFPQVVGAGGQSSTPVFLQPSKVLPRRSVFSGRVLDATGKPVPNTLVSATPGPGLISGCTRTGAGAASVVALDGRFSLPLDPGTYQLDYDPPPGVAAPRATELAVTIAGDVQRDVTLPAAVVIDAVVTGPMGPLANATVRIFEPRCGSSEDCFGPNRTPPWLRGQVQTGTSGNIRAVVAMPAPPAP
jgi:hypothetical protein